MVFNQEKLIWMCCKEFKKLFLLIFTDFLYIYIFFFYYKEMNSFIFNIPWTAFLKKNLNWNFKQLTHGRFHLILFQLVTQLQNLTLSVKKKLQAFWSLLHFSVEYKTLSTYEVILLLPWCASMLCMWSG